MITKEEMGAKPDTELNAILHHLKYCSSQAGSQIASVFVPNYCNSPNDVYPLQVEHLVNTNYRDGMWDAFTYKDFFYPQEFSDNKLCRAIVCCLILVLQEKQQ